MNYQEFAPHSLLSNYIQCFWRITRDFKPIGGVLDVLPDGYIEIIFNIGSPCWVDDGCSRWELPACYIVSHFDKPLRLQTSGVLKTFGVRLFAWGCSLLPTVPLQSTQTIYPLNEEWITLSAQMSTADDVHALDILQSFLIGRMNKDTYFQRALTDNVAKLTQWKGESSIMDLADQCHLSRRQLERQFQNLIHLPPKTLARRLRFEHARDLLSQTPHTSFSEVALACGYADQAHLSREFKHFSNRTLREFVNEIQFIEKSLRFGVGFPFVP